MVGGGREEESNLINPKVSPTRCRVGAVEMIWKLWRFWVLFLSVLKESKCRKAQPERFSKPKFRGHVIACFSRKEWKTDPNRGVLIPKLKSQPRKLAAKRPGEPVAVPAAGCSRGGPFKWTVKRWS